MKKWNKKETYCGQYAKISECENEHRFIKVIFCGKDWCPRCREQTHNRRIGRLLPKVLTMQGFGFFTFTMPPHLRRYYQSKKHLSELRTFIKRKLKRLCGEDLKGITRWHWFGDKSLISYNPHFNAMVEGLQYIPSKDIKELKRSYKARLEKFTGLKVKTLTNPLGKVDLHYYFFSPESLKSEFLKKKHKNYTILSRKKRREIKAQVSSGYSLDEVIEGVYQTIRYHRLSYLVRPTFLIYQKELAQKLKGYINTLTWGRFPELSYEEVEAMAKKKDAFGKISKAAVMLGAGLCPKCGAKIRWFPDLYTGAAAAFGKDLGNGYHEMPIKVKLRLTNPGLPPNEVLNEIIAKNQGTRKQRHNSLREVLLEGEK